MRVPRAPGHRGGRETVREAIFCRHCLHAAFSKRCPCPACMSGGSPGWKALQEEEEQARWAFFCTLPPDREREAA